MFEIDICPVICWDCGECHADCLHHIFGRLSRSPLNAAPLSNNFCHINRKGRMGGHNWHKKPEIQARYLIKTAEYLSSIDYKLTAEDQEFLNKVNEFHRMETAAETARNIIEQKL